MKRKWLFRILRCGLGLLIALLIGWGFYGFIKDDNWLAVSALATLILALGAFLAIWQNRSLQIRERRERLLNEIIEWATDMKRCFFDIDIVLTESVYDRCKIMLTRLTNASVKGNYMLGIGEKQFGQPMCDAIMKVVESSVLYQYCLQININTPNIEYLEKRLKENTNIKKDIEGIREKYQQNKESITTLISEQDLSLRHYLSDLIDTCVDLKSRLWNS